MKTKLLQAVLFAGVAGCGMQPADMANSVSFRESPADRLDADSDGVEDAVDICAETPSGVVVDSNGCGEFQRDSDGDGFSDGYETALTPNTDPFDPLDYGGSVKDADGDGCSDYEESNGGDSCNSDPFSAPVDGQWFFVTTFETPNSGFVVGRSIYELWIEHELPRCVQPGSSVFRSSLHPKFVLLENNGDLQARFALDFVPNSLGDFPAFAGESLVDVSVNGTLIRRDQFGAQFQIDMLQRFIFSGVELRSTGTADYFRFCIPDQSDCSRFDNGQPPCNP